MREGISRFVEPQDILKHYSSQKFVLFQHISTFFFQKYPDDDESEIGRWRGKRQRAYFYTCSYYLMMRYTYTHARPLFSVYTCILVQCKERLGREKKKINTRVGFVVSQRPLASLLSYLFLSFHFTNSKMQVRFAKKQKNCGWQTFRKEWKNKENPAIQKYST